MNAKKLIAAAVAALSVAATGSAFAEQTYPYVDFTGVKSTKSRAEVVSELQAARADRNFVIGGTEYVAPENRVAGDKTREQIRAELRQSQADGSYARSHQEYEGQVPVANTRGSARLAGDASNGNAY